MVATRSGEFCLLAYEGKVFGGPVVTTRYPPSVVPGRLGGEEGAQGTTQPSGSWLRFLLGKFLARTPECTESIALTRSPFARGALHGWSLDAVFIPSRYLPTFAHQVFFILDQRHANLQIIASVSTEFLHFQAP